ncbi:Gfo/Idh/MocA family oxidoreductase [Nocardia speluncae]|uniref:Gfo/Idh/MocA family oxidoreductase n=1 Tax=Nocardia speluncae TaxID=419477 RepID=A0A846XH84_9NOCA|nr:Gfo/Idh/MocA family oxidoreductase [Nocardia speluncae]NKY35352.1 Gfo/Idh/MocA family oxidoreductase [Nocardia speluncae]
MRAAIVGTGHIADSYARTLRSRGVHVVACTDIDRARAIRFATRWGSRYVTDLGGIADYRPDVAINLTSPVSHGEVSSALIELGVPVYTEKPLAHVPEVARTLVARSDRREVALMCAPDTLFGEPQQQMRRILDAGMIGRPLLLHGQIAWSGHEQWHPRPQFLYRSGAGPLLDLGPYWVTAMIHLVGPAVAVTAVDASTGHEALRIAGMNGLPVPEVPLTVVLLIEFRSGVIGTLAMSFEWPATTAPAFQIVGESGTLICDVPLFEGRGTVRCRRRADSAWTVLPSAPPMVRWQRGIGAVQMLRDRAAAEPLLDKRQALHTLDILHAAATSMDCGRRIPL